MQGLYYLAEQSNFVDPYGDDIFGRFFGQGIQTAVLGMVIVFAVLSIIWGFLELFRVIFYTIPERKKAESAAALPENQEASSTEDSEEYVVAAAEDDGEIVAAIVAAVTAFRAEENVSAPAFRVVSFKKRK